MADVPDDIARRLYAVPPDRFVAERDAAVARARAAGDREAARLLAKLRRPTIAAWMVNLLAIRRPDLIAHLARLATGLRSAQRELRGPDLRELSTRRRELVATLVREARALALAADPGVDPGRLPLAEVESTLSAALADADVAAEVAAGRLARAVAYAGLGEVPRPRLRLVTGGAGADAEERGGSRRSGERGVRGPAGTGGERGVRGPAGTVSAADLAVLRRAVATARTAGKRAAADLERALVAERDTAAQLAGVEAQLAELERRRSAVEQELSRLKLARRAAERAVVAARRRIGEAEGAIESVEPGAPAGDDGTGPGMG